jgi:geranylgeranyl reductase family protein
MNDQWDVAVVGGGPAGFAAATAASRNGARTIVLERAVHPRYKTCGGGLIGTSLAAIDGQAALPVREHVSAATFTLRGKRAFTRSEQDPLLAMVVRDEFDDALRLAAVAAGAHVRQRAVVRAVGEDADHAWGRLADGTVVKATVMIGADGSAGVSHRYVGVEFAQVDLGLEAEIVVPEAVQREWKGKVLIDWGPIPGSYGWVFPKAGRLTVGVIAARGYTDRTRDYLRAFIGGLGLGSFPVARDSGHLTRGRTRNSPLRRGRVLVAGDAAGLLEPFTREGISFALRSGSLAGTIGAKSALGLCEEPPGEALDEYANSVGQSLAVEMDAGRRILEAFVRHPGVVHAGLATAPGWRAFSKFCRGELAFGAVVDRRLVGPAISLLGRV